MSRIIAGTLKGRRIATPKGDRTRPTSDRVREALFNALAPGGNLEGLRVADFFAGSGAIGLEACSRGAAFALMVEAHPGTARILRRNIADLGLTDRAEVMAAKAATVASTEPDEPFDIIFADPPYELSEEELETFLAQLQSQGWYAPGADIVIERGGKSPEPRWPSSVSESRSRRYGSSTLWYGLLT